MDTRILTDSKTRMGLRAKITLMALMFALLPLLAAMGIAVVHSGEQMSRGTIEAANGYLSIGSEELSAYFAERKSEMSLYANSPIVRTMDWQQIGPYFRAEVKRHNGVYEKLLLGRTDGHFYNTSKGNPAYGGLLSFDDSDPNAKLRTISERKYWQVTARDNTTGAHVIYVSDPMISYTTGVQQVMVAASVISDEGEVLGMISGSIEWSEIQSRIDSARNHILEHFDKSAKVCMVSSDGIYIGHWDPDKLTHLKLDADGKSVLNEIGEKIAVKTKITEEPLRELADIGRKMVNGESGSAFYVDPATGEEMIIIYAPVKSANYSMALILPKASVMAPVTELKNHMFLIVGIAAALVIAVTYFLGRRIAKPVISLDNSLKQSRDFSENIIETANNVIVAFDLHGCITKFNRFAEEITGYDRREVLGKNGIELFIDETDEERMTKALQETMVKGHTVDIEIGVVCKNGEKKVIMCNNSALKNDDGEIIGTISLGNDITESKEADEKLEESEKRFMDVLYGSPDPIQIIDGETFVQCNEATLRILEYATRDEMLMVHPSELSPPKQPDGRDSHEKASEVIQAAFETGHQQFEWMHRKSTGEDFPVEVTLTLFFYKGKRMLYSLWRDLTEQKRIEAEAEQAREEAMTASEELARNVHELERFNRFSVDREMRLIELKQEVNDLCARLGETPPYHVQAPKKAPAAPDADA